MSRWISPDARPFVAEVGQAGDEPWRSVQALTALEPELTTPRRVAGGFVAALAVAAGGLGIGLIAFVDGFAPRAAVLVVALVVLAAGLVLTRSVLQDGHDVLAAYRAWSAVDDRRISPASIYTGQFTARSLARTALGAAALLAATFAWSLVYLGLASGDPADLGGGRATLAVMGLVWAAGLSVATWCLLSVELRAGRARALRVTRSR